MNKIFRKVTFYERKAFKIGIPYLMRSEERRSVHRTMQGVSDRKICQSHHSLPLEYAARLPRSTSMCSLSQLQARWRDSRERTSSPLLFRSLLHEVFTVCRRLLVPRNISPLEMWCNRSLILQNSNVCLFLRHLWLWPHSLSDVISHFDENKTC